MIGCNNYGNLKFEILAPKRSGSNDYGHYGMDSVEEYNKQELTIKLQNIYNENKYNFSLKEK